MQHTVSAFFTGYSATRGEAGVEAVAVVLSEGGGPEPMLRFVVVNEDGRASLANAEELNLYGAYDQRHVGEDDESPEPR
jgi:hypothetical protein